MRLVHEGTNVFVHQWTVLFNSVNRINRGALTTRNFNGLNFKKKLRVFHLLIIAKVTFLQLFEPSKQFR